MEAKHPPSFFERVKTKLMHEDVQRSLEALKQVEVASSQDTEALCHGVCLVTPESCAGENLMKDIEMFVDFSGSTDNNTVFSTFETSLTGSKSMLRDLLNTPISNVATLNERVKVVQRMETHVTPETHSKFQRLKELENDIAWIFIEKDENLKDLFNIVYFKWMLFDHLNNAPSALTSTIFYKIILSPMVGILSPIVYFVIPYLVLRYKFGFKQVSFVQYLRITYTSMMSMDLFAVSNQSMLKWVNVISQVMSMLFYFQGVFNSIELSRTFYKVSNHITQKMNSVAEFVATCKGLFDTMWDDSIKKVFFDYKELDKPLELGFNSTHFSIFSNFGKQLAAFKGLDTEALKRTVQKAYILDAIYSVAGYKKKHGAVYPLYKDGNEEKPCVEAHGIWHPCIPYEKAVKNDITVSKFNNAIVTGPNAGGKSTFIKSLLVNIVFSQTIGISLSSQFSLSPFHKVHSQINLPDSKGHESLFEAEMYRCKAVLDMLRAFPEQRTIVVMDEIFNSTNPVEGIAGAFAIVKKISEYPNAVLLFTTHYGYLTKLEKATGRFKNYRMNIIKDNVGITYPYKLEKGVSRQYIALELLQRNGFDEDIITEALEIKERFTRK